MGGGILGVSFFFVLSGFVMTLGYADKINNDFNYKRYLTKRLAVIFPLHWFCLIWAIVLAGGINLTKHNIILLSINALLLQSWVPKMDVYFSYNGVSWYLSSLMLFVVLFPYIIKYIANNQLLRCVFVCVIVFFYLFAICMTPEKYHHSILYIHPIMRTVDCLFGVGLAYLFKSIKGKVCLLPNIKIDLSLIILICILVFCSANISFRYCSAIFWIPIGLILLIVSVHSREDNQHNSLLMKCLSNNFIIKISECYFVFYLIHQLMISTMSSFWAFGLDNSLQRNLFKFSTLLMTIVVSMLINEIFQKPLKRCVQKV